MNPFLKRQQDRTKHGNRSARRLSRKLGAKETPASGAIPGAKGDMVKPKVLIEAKSTVNGSIGIRKDWLDKITQEALERNRTPVCLVSFVDGSGQKRDNGDWVLVPMHVYKEYMS